MSESKQKRVKVHFTDKRREVMRTAYMPADEAERAFSRALQELEETEGHHDRWITSLSGLAIRASEVGGIELETLFLPSVDVEPRHPLWDMKF